MWPDMFRKKSIRSVNCLMSEYMQFLLTRTDLYVDNNKDNLIAGENDNAHFSHLFFH